MPILQSNVVRDYVLSFAPDYPTIGTQTSFPVKTGVSGTCNAFYDYTMRVVDVVTQHSQLLFITNMVIT